MLVSVPGVVANKLVAEKEPLLVLVNVRDRARCKRESKVVFTFIRYPSVRCIDIEIRVVVGIEE